MILRCTYEELSALTDTARAALDAAEAGDGYVAAPPEVIAAVEDLLPRLDGDLGIETYFEQQEIEGALTFVLDHCRYQMNTYILQQHVGSEDSVTAYFDYAHVLTVHDRVQRMGEEMAALIEVMTGRPPTEESSRTFTFPD